ncbi:LmbU family transcriptional regulator [Sphaerisporangium dianthi]|uniref:LmbU family transcriptional regulator n=1 Tax=Sphaerisporangium dianthi TaxID=1436120 RepID=A0ABV9CSI6_9ACTN
MIDHVGENGNHQARGLAPVPKPAHGDQQRLGLDPAVIPRRTGLQFPAPIPLASWERIGRQLSLIADSSAWWLGDWLVYGESHYNERYRMAIERTALDYQTLRNYAWVTRRFSLARRRDRLSFAHHAEVAALGEPEQDLWLQRAEQFGWSRNRLRKELKGAAALKRGAGRDVVQAEAVPVGAGFRLSPSDEQLERWELAARLQNCELSNWVVQALEMLAEEVIKQRAAASA